MRHSLHRVAVATVATGGWAVDSVEEPALSDTAQHAEVNNGISLDGISLNGISLNGTSLDAISFDAGLVGISLNGTSLLVTAQAAHRH